MIIVYEAKKPRPVNTIWLHFLRILASGMITFSIVSVIFYFWPIVKEEFDFRQSEKKSIRLGFGDLIQRMDASDALTHKIDPYFSISIPKINAKANIISNVDSGNSIEYLESLKSGVAHAKGTNFPGQSKLIYLFSHSTNSPLNFSEYNAVFYLLHRLDKNDKIDVYFLNKKYVYKVIEKRVVEASDTSWLINNEAEEKLILQTCDPPGTSLRRLIVVAVPI